jgi:3-dehydroquinate synthase
MKKIQLTIATAPKEYSITIGENILEKISEIINLTHYSSVFIITDKTAASLFLKKLLSSLPKNTKSVILPTGENEKNIENAQKIWKIMASAKLDRKSLVINLGGGVIGDIGGFTAGTYMRGTHFMNVPTTLLSQVDESVGGKTMVNFEEIKNLIGVFYQPSAVIIDVQTLKTLPERQVLSGFAEIIKHGLIADKKYFEKVTSKHPLDFSNAELIDIITRSCEIKKEIVENDIHEKGPRKLVNFGHTIGHAIEAISLETEKPLLHGEAVSIGMVAEAKLSQLSGLISEQDVQMIKQALIKAGLPTEIKKVNKNYIFEKMQLDKKNEHGKITFTLLEKIGKAVINQFPEKLLIEKALKEILV